MEDLKVVKRDGKLVDFDFSRIELAIMNAYEDYYGEDSLDREEIEDILDNIYDEIVVFGDESISVEEIQNIVVDKLTNINKDVGKAYEEYRNERTKVRTKDFLDNIKNNIIVKISTENSNANVDENNAGGKELRIVEKITEEIADSMLPKDILYYRQKGILKIHDYGKFALGVHNCLNIDYPHLLEEGFKTRQADTRPAKSYQSACQLLAVMMQSQSLDMFGGVGLVNFSIHMTKYLKMTIAQELQYISNILDLGLDIPSQLRLKEAKELVSEDVYNKLYKRIVRILEQTHQALITNLVTLQSRSGHQLPFSSINLGLIDEDNEEESALIIEYMLKEMQKGIGKRNRTAIFPILCFQVKTGVNRYPQDKYYYLRMLAQQVAHDRLYPSFVNCDWKGNVVVEIDDEMNMMGCRTALCKNVKTGSYSKIGRGNNFPTTINLPYLALLSKRDGLDFYMLLDEMLNKAEEVFQIRWDIMRKQPPTLAPFMYGNRTILGADKCKDTVEPALENNTFGIGFIGIEETVKALTGYFRHENEEAKKLGLDIVKRIRKRTDELTEKYNLNFATYFTPAEGYCEQARNKIAQEFGIVKGITDKDYITNSVMCLMDSGLNIFEKIDIEGEYGLLGNGGEIFHYEYDGSNYNEKAITKVIDYAFDHDISYLRLSHPIATCLDCSYKENNLMYECGECGSENIENLAIVTGYLSSDVKFMNKGKQDEVKHRRVNPLD